jgi:Cu(I)/Ag(I) efflux system periplasmic protein CusF
MMKLERMLGAVLAAATMALALPARAQADGTEGEVRKVDKEAAKVTLKHGPIKELDMPAMTMVFGVRDKALLDKLQPGDKVRFKAVHADGKYTVTEVQVLK